MKNKIKIFAIFFMMVLLLVPNKVFASVFETQIVVKDIDKSNNIIEGFEYEILFEDGTTQKLKTVDKGIHEISLDIGKYTLRATKVAEGYEEPKELKIELPVGDGVQLSTELSIFPKHFRGERHFPWPKLYEDTRKKNDEPEDEEENKRDLEKESLDELKKYENNHSGEGTEENGDDKKKEDNKKENKGGNNYAKTGEGIDTLLLLALIGFAITSVILAYYAGVGSKKESKEKKGESL